MRRNLELTKTTVASYYCSRLFIFHAHIKNMIVDMKLWIICLFQIDSLSALLVTLFHIITNFSTARVHCYEIIFLLASVIASNMSQKSSYSRSLLEEMHKMGGRISSFHSDDINTRVAIRLHAWALQWVDVRLNGWMERVYARVYVRVCVCMRVRVWGGRNALACKAWPASHFFFCGCFVFFLQ